MRGKVRLTQYLESQEDQDMTRLALLHHNSREHEERMFLCALEHGRGGLMY